MPVPSEDNIPNDVLVTMAQEFDNSHCNTMANHNNFRSYPTAMPQDIPMQSEDSMAGCQQQLEEVEEYHHPNGCKYYQNAQQVITNEMPFYQPISQLYLIHVNSGDSFSVPQPDGSLQNITGPVTVQLLAPNGMPPPITAPPGYMLQYTEEGGGGGKHIRILPLAAPPVMDPQNSFGHSVPHPHQPPIPMPGMQHPHPGFFPPAHMVPNYRSESPNFYPQQMVYAEEPQLPGGYRFQKTRSIAAGIAAQSRICANTAFQSALNPPCSCGAFANNSRIKVLSESIQATPLSHPLASQICSYVTCKDTLGRLNLDTQLSIMDQSKNVSCNSVTLVSKQVSSSTSDTAFSSSSVKSLDEMSDSSFTPMSPSQSASSSSGSISGSSLQSRIPESNDWQRSGASEHLHPEHSASGDSPTRTSSSMTSSSPSASSMASSPRNSPSLIPTNGHKGGPRSPMRQSPAAKPFRPAGQFQGFVPPSYGPHSVKPPYEFQVTEEHSVLNKENISVENDNQTSGDSKTMDSIIELLKTVTKPEVKDIEIRKARIIWANISLEKISSELKERIESNAGIHFDLQLSESKKNLKFASVYNGKGLEYTVGNLKPGFDYSVRLHAVYDTQLGPSSDLTTFRTLSTVPDAPLYPKVQKASKEYLHLKWQQPCDNGERISKYHLECNDGSQPSSFRSVYSGPLKNFKVQKLVPSHSYVFRLAAENKIGKSDWSALITYCTSGVPPPTPEPPILEQATISNLSLMWNKPITDVSKFALEMNDETTGYGFRTMYNGPELRYTVKHLARMTNYKFRLKASNNFGSSNYSQVVVYTTNPDKPLPPGRPHVKGSVYSYSVTLAWDAPRDDGGSVITGYKVQKAKAESPFNEVVHDGPQKECHVKDLDPGQVYHFRVVSKTDKDSSSPSDILSVTTRPISPGPNPVPILALRPKPNCITIKWDPPQNTGGAEILKYEVNWMPVSEDPDLLPQIGFYGSKSECTIGDLHPGTKYSFAVRATNEVGFGGWSDRLEVITGPGSPSKPELPDAVVLSSHAIQLNWKAPLSNGSEITKYSLQWGAAETALAHHSTKGPVLTHEFNSLSPDTTYYYSLQALNSVGPSSSSDVGSAKTLPSWPERVSNLRFSPDVSENPQPSVTARRVLITWDKPRDNGSAILSYKVHVSSDPTSDDTSETTQTTYDVDADVINFDAVDLNPDTDYRFKVCAVNSLGTGPFSSSFAAHTRPLPPDAPNLECVQYAYNSLRLQWSCGGKVASGTVYLLQKISKKENTKRLQTVHRGPEQSCLVSGLNEQTTYGFRICAINSEGQGPFATQHFTTKIQAPAAMKSPVIRNIKSTECHILWQKCNKIKGDPIFYRLTLEKQGKVLFEKDMEDTKYVLSKLAPHTTYHLSVAAVRYLSQKEPSSPQMGDSADDSSTSMEPEIFEISGPTSPLVELYMKGSPSNVIENPTLTQLIVSPPENVRESPAKSKESTDPLQNSQDGGSPLTVVRKVFLDFLHDDDRFAHRQVAFFYVCAILFAIITSWIYI